MGGIMRVCLLERGWGGICFFGGGIVASYDLSWCLMIIVSQNVSKQQVGLYRILFRVPLTNEFQESSDLSHPRQQGNFRKLNALPDTKK